LRKLFELPRTQRLRKAAKLAEEAERRFIVSGKLWRGEAEYLAAAVELLARDEAFSPLAAEALRAAQKVLSADNTELEREGIRRALNSVHFLLLSETGRNQADWDFIGATGALDSSKRRSFAGMQVFLEDIRSPFNVGSMFRTAESFGVEKIWLSPFCADPRHKRAERSAMGCIEVLPWERLSSDPFAGEEGAGTEDTEQENAAASFSAFSEGSFFTMETGGIPIEDFPFPARGIMIAGSEELGVSPRALEAADASLGRVTVPTWGAKGSLNVSVAFGIVMQAWSARLSKSVPGDCV